MNELRKDMPPLPRRFAKLPVDERGFPVPAFVDKVNGKWDFRVVKRGHVMRCIRRRECWLCGEPLGRYTVFVVGPMCVVNRVSSEPPIHRDCAEFSARACPFLTQPMAKRNERDLPDHTKPAGIMIKRNPGVIALVTARTWGAFDAGNGNLIRFDEPFTVEWWSRGREATGDEIAESIASGLPLLREAANKDGRKALLELNRNVDKLAEYLPDPNTLEQIRSLAP